MASVGLDLSAAGRDEEDKAARVAREIGGEEAGVSFRLPDGTQTSPVNVQVGQTVMFLKAMLEKEHGLKMASLELTLSGAVLIDPLSISDCGIGGGSSVVVDVKAN